MTAGDARTTLKGLASPEAAARATRFFKTGPGQYAEGDTFIGVTVPTLRTVARELRALPLGEVRSLLHTPVHEERHVALLILVLRVAKGDAAHRKQVSEFHLGNTHFTNNRDLVDCSAPQVVGGYLMTGPKEPLYTLAKSKSLWEQRIAIVATQHFVRHGRFAETLAVSELLLGDTEDLIHKATGWTLREVGKKDRAVLEGFLDRHATAVPRTTLRYAIERFPPERRWAYLQKKPNPSRDTAGGG
jgi:3-methyladenine DNA glycosylase AlkD